ncbi:hypothetical protein [Halobacteriovorax sp.]|uniref:hypothetical protein n=1 Tax=Halobacteriovorax sp. TaxID=2020862 RepID=UPI003AF21F51
MQKSKRERVIIGMDGGIDSAVTALLLKKQGYDCIGVNISFFERVTQEDEDFVTNFKTKLTPEGRIPDELADDEEMKEGLRRFEKIKWVRRINHIFKDWFCAPQEQIKDICRLIGIPFYVTNASSEFEDRVISLMLKSRFAGIWQNPSLDRATLIFDILNSKLEALKATKIATGHYCKVIANHGQFGLVRPNDPNENDCHLLSNLSQESLSRLLLPIADLNTSEVDRIGALVSANSFTRAKLKAKKKARAQTYQSDELCDLYPRYVAPKFIRESNIYDHSNDNVVGAHDAHFRYHLGQTHYKTKEGIPRVPDSQIVVISMSRGHIFIAKNKELEFERIVCHHFENFNVVDTAKPLECYGSLLSNGDTFKGTLYLLNNGNIFFDLEDKKNGIVFRGDTIMFFLKDAPSAKAIGHAKVYQSGHFVDGQFYMLPLSKREKEELEETQALPKKREIGF